MGERPRVLRVVRLGRWRDWMRDRWILSARVDGGAEMTVEVTPRWAELAGFRVPWSGVWDGLCRNGEPVITADAIMPLLWVVALARVWGRGTEVQRG